LQDFGEETEGKIVLGSLAVEGKHFKIDLSGGVMGRRGLD